MHIKESLVYDKHTGELTDLGDINSHILAFEKSLTNSKSLPLATTMITFM